jgi:hypothetical protein
MQETNFSKDYNDNPYHILFKNPEELAQYQKDPVSYTMNKISEKNKLAQNLGKTSDEDRIQAWNGYGKIANRGSMYGIDTNKNPIDMNTNPVYGKRIVNLRDSVINKNPELVNMINGTPSFNQGGYFGPAYSISGGIGSVPSFGDKPVLTDYKGGGTHEQNPLGGIPIGKARVEEGEERFDDPKTGESYIFSNRY